MSGAWYDLSAKRALVVGASRGLGRATALALAAAGADVDCAARDAATLEATCAAIRALGRTSAAFPLDVADAPALRAAVQAAGSGQLDILVYAAGLMHAEPALTLQAAEWDRCLAVNLTGALVAAQTAGQQMKAQGRGRIVMFSSAFVDCVLPYTTAYGASKAGLQQLVISLALEWARYGITVNAVAPGYFATDMPRAVLDDSELRQRVLTRIPLRRVGEPDEIGPLVIYLASDASAFMTGAVLTIDGGQSLNVS